MTEEAQNIIKTIKQMEASLDDEKERGYDLETSSLRVTYPLIDCLRDLKEKHNVVSRLHRERFEQVKKLVQALESYSSHLEASFIKIKLPPTSSNSCPPNFDLSPSYVATLDEEFTRVYDEYNKRVNIIRSTAEEIVRLWSELGIPQAQTDSSIVQNYRESPEQLGLHQSDLERIRSRRDKLLDEKRGREKRLAEMKVTIEGLWDRLGVEDPDRKAFLAANRGVGLRTINEFEDELARLNELKRQNLHLFVEDARVRLQELWDQLYFSEEEMLDFTPAFSDVYSDALLSSHEAEIERLTTLKETRAPILAVIERHRSLINDRETLAASANDASRLMLKPQKGEKRDPGKLLREEKMRKRIAKDLPKVTAELAKTLERYEEEYGRPFLVHGERYLDEIAAMEVKAPPPRSKTPNALPPRSKTPAGPAPTSRSQPASVSRAAAPARPASAMRGPAPNRNATKTPTGFRPGTRSQAAPASVTSTAPASQIKSPSKIPARVPLGTSQYGGNNSPERRAIPRPQQQVSHNHSRSAHTMGPPRIPPPKMQDLFTSREDPSSTMKYSNAPGRPASFVSSSDSNASSRIVRPMSPEDVYDDRERMSYLSTSQLNHNRQYQHDFHSSMQHSSSVPSLGMSRQTSNTSSNLTTATTATGSENWETFSDSSELEPQRHENYKGLHAANGMRVIGAHSYGQMAPPPKRQRQFDEGNENSRTIVMADREPSWSTEAEDTY